MANPYRGALLIALVVALPATFVRADVKLTGVNLATAAFGPHLGLPGEYNKHYTYPTPQGIDYFVKKGTNVIRLPFLWERLQRELGAEFYQPELERLQAVVDHATKAGARVILDPHNYARYHGTIIGTGDVTNAHFADFWVRLANLYKDNDRVIFGLVNEPYGMPSTEHWVTTANTAIAAIRNTGADNLVLVPGNAYSGAHSWTAGYYGTPNSVAMLDIVDPGDNYAFDVHQYLDADSSGTKDVIVSETIGAERLNVFTQWAKTHNKRAFLGEFAVANAKIGDGPEQIGDEALANMLDHMDDNSDVWLGWSWWAAGPWWNEYMFTLEPTNLGLPTQQDRPAMGVLGPRLAGVAVPEPAGASLLLGGGAVLALRRGRR
jgi:endoglucanase